MMMMEEKGRERESEEFCAVVIFFSGKTLL